MITILSPAGESNPLRFFRHPRRALLPLAILTDRQQPKTNKYDSVKY